MEPQKTTSRNKDHCVCLFVLGVEDNMQEVVGHITEGVCRPLKVSK